MFMKVLKKCLKIFIILIGLFIVGNICVYTYAKLSPKIEIKNANSFMLFDSDNEVFLKDLKQTGFVPMKTFKINKDRESFEVIYEIEGNDFKHVFKVEWRIL